MAATDDYEAVLRAAKDLGLIDSAGNLMKLDSIMIVDFVIALEQSAGGIEIPLASVRPDVFRSIESVAQMLAGVREGVVASAT